MILSHAHADHSGEIPFLVKNGFNGPIYCTPATLDLCRIMLVDSAHIQESDILYVNKKRRKKGEELFTPLYTAEDVYQCLKQFVAVPYDVWTEIDSHIKFMFTDAGHILGSAAVNLIFEEPEGTKKIYFSGDTGRYCDIILRPPQPFPQADFIITESTYGDRLHESVTDAETRLLNIVKSTCVENQGKLIIPAFSLGRTQELVYALDRLHTQGLLPHIPLYIDSPLATNATAIMRKHTESFNPSILEYMKKDADPFGYDDAHYIQEVADSIALNDTSDPCIIISASGMMDAGRIKHHIKNNISDVKNTVMIVGFVTPNSLGGRLKSGAAEVRIYGKLYPVNARIETLDYYSAHADYNELLLNLSCQDPAKVKKVFVVHGEEEAQKIFRLKLVEKGFQDVVIPALGESFTF
jgi:metallo-beta-lactamase family protein